MSANTKISWTQQTWNPIIGCSHVSEGCRNCYAERMDKRIRAARGEQWKEWSAQNSAYNVRLHPERLQQPLHWQTPRMVFVNSMSDLFHENVPFEFIDSVMNMICVTPKHTYQILTKRHSRMLKYFTRAQDGYRADNIKNMWLGVSVEDQRTADERIPLLLQTPAAMRFLSCEPLLDQTDVSAYLHSAGVDGGVAEHFISFTIPRVDWVIVGGESGPHYREMNLDWARNLRDQCVAAGVPFFFKQQSGYRSETNPTLDGVEWHQFPNHNLQSS